MSSYDYVRRTYGVDPVVGQRARHTVTGKFGVIARMRSPDHYVHVQFDGQRYAVPCHPTELDYTTEGPANER